MKHSNHYQTYIFIFIGFVFAVGLAGVGWMVIFTRTKTPLPYQPVDSVWTQIMQECSQQQGEDGFGQALIHGHTIVEGESAELTVSCKLTLAADAHLEIVDSDLITQNLVIANSEPDRPVHVSITNTTLRGVDAGLHIGMQASGSQLQVRDSSLNYALSVSLSVGSSDSDLQAGLAVQNSRLQSQGSESEGIVVVSTGTAQLQDNQFQTNDPADQALLLADNCVTNNNTGLNVQCQERG